MPPVIGVIVKQDGMAAWQEFGPEMIQFAALVIWLRQDADITAGRGDPQQPGIPSGAKIGRDRITRKSAYHGRRRRLVTR